MLYQCADKTVTAKATATDGTVAYGFNGCVNDIKCCPYPTGDKGDYTLCKTVCGQVSHAEVMAASELMQQGKIVELIEVKGANKICSGCQCFCKTHNIEFKLISKEL